MLLWYNEHSKNLEWYQELESNGLHVKALDDRPTLSGVDEFYFDLYVAAGGRPIEVIAVSELYGLGPGETLEAVQICKRIKRLVHADN